MLFRSFKDIIIYGGIAIAVIAILFIVYKLISNKSGNDEMYYRRSYDIYNDQRGGLPIENNLLHPLLILLSIVFYVFRK